MKGIPVDELVFGYMFSKMKSSDPTNFQEFLAQHLIPEVREETHAFYGHLDTHEAKYPGLDYTHPTHRIRLSRWPWHRRLFRCFDNLRLTDAEIATLTKWEGTKWAKEKYEKEQGVIIRDTTSDGIPDWEELREQPRRVSSRNRAPGHGNDGGEDESMQEDGSDDELTESIGRALSQQLLALAAQTGTEDGSGTAEEEWEQWFKHAMETSGQLGTLTQDSTEQLYNHVAHSGRFPFELIPDGMMERARAGRWNEVSSPLHPILRYALDLERQGAISSTGRTSRNPPSAREGATRFARASASGAGAAASSRRTMSSLRLPTSEASTSSRAAGA